MLLNWFFFPQKYRQNPWSSGNKSIILSQTPKCERLIRCIYSHNTGDKLIVIAISICCTKYSVHTYVFAYKYCHSHHETITLSPKTNSTPLSLSPSHRWKYETQLCNLHQDFISTMPSNWLCFTEVQQVSGII